MFGIKSKKNLLLENLMKKELLKNKKMAQNQKIKEEHFYLINGVKTIK
jgi:hypothetical protein